MKFVTKKIKTKENPFFSENFSLPKKENLGVFFGPLVGPKNKFKVRIQKTTILISTFFFLVFVYLSFVFWQLFAPPSIIIFYPPDKIVISEKSIIIKGQVEKRAMVRINEQPIVNSSEQFFTELIALSPGLNLVKITAKKRFSQEKVIWRQIIVQ